MFHLPICSPVEEIFDPSFIKAQVRVFVKRDDMIHPHISGNKWRKLKYILAHAHQLNRRHLVTFGGAYSNHLIATACAAAKFGFRSTGLVRGEEVQNEVLMLCRLFGMNLLFTDRSSYRDKLSLYKFHFRNDQESFFIDEGGAGELGVKGCSELPAELEENFHHIFCPAGTGTTAAGIGRGCEEASPITELHIVSVLKGGNFLRAEIDRYTGHPFELYTEYHFGGYAHTTAELMDFIKHFCSSTGILIEPVYTGKMFFALYDLIRKGRFAPGNKILAIHTGGLSGLSGMVAKLNLSLGF